MVRAPSQLTHMPKFIIVILSLLTLIAPACLSSGNPTNPHLLLPLAHPHARPAYILPLHRSTTNSSTSNPHRLLQRSESSRRPNAHMRLYDDLLLNGYYTTRLWIGTPPQRFALIVDTGSTVTYVPCSTCELCGIHQDPKFDPEISTTYQHVKCNIDCTCDNDMDKCVYERQYAEMSTSSGVLGEDLISFGNQSELAPQRAVFGCENEETGDLFTQRADGIMGLGRGDLSILDQLVDKGVISDSFSLCYGGMDIGGGAMVLGGISPPSDMVFAYSDPVKSPYYNIDLKEIHVAGKRLNLEPSVFDRKHGTVLDSGTTYAYLPEAAFLAFMDAIMKELNSLKQIRGPDPRYKDVCFSGAGSDVSGLSNTFPAVDMVFGNGQKLSLSPENYLFRHAKVSGAYCLGIFQNGKDPSTLLGGILVRNTLVTYDRNHSKIGFWKTNCSELWERLQVSGSPPQLASAPNEKNSSLEAPPALAPTEAPHYVLPGFISSGHLSNLDSTDGLKIGQITFDMSLNISYSDLKPQLTKLVEYVAHGLDINASQVRDYFGTKVRLSNATPDGNNSLSKWVISPAGSADYISNGTATRIVFQLAEHGMQLPITFGHYKVVGWNIEPKSKRSSWQRKNVVAILAIVVALAIGLTAFGLVVFWKHQQQTTNLYKPVDVAVPEQELQPLSNN